MKSFYILISLAFCLVGCKQTEEKPADGILFTSSQPQGEPSLSKIPRTFRGTFMNKDSVLLQIGRENIIKEYHWLVRFHMSERDSLRKEGIFLKGNLAVIKGIGYPAKMVSDSIEISFSERDTLFNIGQGMVAKRIDRSLVLNYKDSIFWNICIIEHEKNKVRLRYVGIDDKPIFDSIVKTTSKQVDSTRFVYSPNAKEFESVLKNLRRVTGSVYFKVTSK